MNNTILIVGKVLELYLPDTCVDSHGNVDLNLAETVAISGIDTYHQGQQLKRLEYARV